MANLCDAVNLAVLDAMVYEPPRRIFRQRCDPFEIPDDKFIKLYRLNKDMVTDVINIVEEFGEPVSRTSALNSQTKVLTALQFFARGSYQSDVGHNIYTAISQPSVSRVIHNVINALNQQHVLSEWVKFPSNIQELQTLRNRFYQRYGFPGVIGCIDCTHVAIVAPGIKNHEYPEHIYINRKGYHFINVQLICDPDLRIIHMNARFPGSTHDSYIFNNSNVLPVLKRINEYHGNGFYLLGDSGYPLRPWLLTPLNYAEPETPEAAYSDSLRRTRSVIERCNGVLKLRFRCLLKHRVLHYSPNTASKIINACIVLHNMCIQNGLPTPQPDEEDDQLDFGMYDHVPHIENVNVNFRRANPDLARGRALQRHIIRSFFT